MVVLLTKPGVFKIASQTSTVMKFGPQGWILMTLMIYWLFIVKNQQVAILPRVIPKLYDSASWIYIVKSLTLFSIVHIWTQKKFSKTIMIKSITWNQIHQVLRQWLHINLLCSWTDRARQVDRNKMSDSNWTDSQRVTGGWRRMTKAEKVCQSE